MDDKTQQMLVTVGAGLAKKVLMLQAAALVSHGVISSNYTEIYVSLGMAAIGAAWSFWNDFGKAIVLSQLEVLKAKSLAQAAKLNQAGLPQVTVSQIAAQSPTLTAAEVTKTAATLPAAIQANIAKILLVAFVLSAFLANGQAQAQGKPLQITGNVKADAAANFGLGDKPALTGNIERDAQAIWKKIASVTKADLTYAMAKAKAANTNASAVRLQCLQAISDANDQANGAGLKNPDGTDMVRPDPALVTSIEDVAELVDNLSPQGRLFTSCAGAAQMFKTTTLAVINSIVTGAAGIAMLPAGL